MLEAVKTDISPMFVEAFRGSFTSMMRWPHLDDFWLLLNQQADDNWYIYAVGEQPPEETVAKDTLLTFIKEIDILLRKEHDEDYLALSMLMIKLLLHSSRSLTQAILVFHVALVITRPYPVGSCANYNRLNSNQH